MRRMALMSLVALGLMADKAWTETYVSGTITTDITWNMVGSPYIATDTVTVAQGVALTIEPGVTIKFAPEISLICYGTLSAVGTSIGTITFTSNQITPTASDWNGIKLSGIGANGSRISYCDIGYAEQAVYLENVSGITITYNYIHDNKGNQGKTGDDYGSGGAGGIGCGIYLSSSTNNTISGNTISGNTGGQGGTGGWGHGSGGTGGIGCGIYLSSSTNNTISGNTISRNTGGQGGTGGYGGGASSGASGQGYGIYIDSNSYNNTINSANTYNSEPIHYYYNQSGITIQNQILTLAGSGSTNLGRIVLINCQNFTIQNNSISGGIGQNGSTGGYIGGIGCGIYLGSSTNIVISRNIVSLNTGGEGGVGNGYAGPGGSGGIGCGIYLHSSTNNTISLNTISSNTGGQGGKGNYTSAGGIGGIGCGIYFSSSTNNTASGNIILSSTGGQEGRGSYYGASGNGYGIYISTNSYNNAIDSSNTYNGESIHYYYNQSGIAIKNQNLTIAGSGSTNLGRIVLIYCQNFTIKSNFIAGGIGQNGQTAGGWEGAVGAEGNMGCGIYLGSSTNITISENIISSNIGGQGGTGGWWGLSGSGGVGCGIYLNSSTNIIILENTIFNNKGGQRGNVAHMGRYGNYGQGYGMYSCFNSFPSIHYNTLSENKNGDDTKGYGVYHDGSSGTISATLNWCGHLSGPYHPTTNPSGTGNQVSDWVDYRPWTGPKIIITPYFGLINTTVIVEGQYFATQTQISISFGTHQTITTTISSSNG
ncbi:right-handed parallel beta-helix repeat-containing protein, partial [bacterium]|nr:right-handed parallel beta-helix repeat-containing protein [bacterium]MBU1598850.1 right-handed parallel beta-helix repeat-containing protein [bacterium]